MVDLVPLVTGNTTPSQADLNSTINNVNIAIEEVAATAGAGGTVTSVSASGGTTGLSFTGSPVTTTGTFTLTGTLNVTNGGTGTTTSTGTGSAVLSNNPSLITPALDTPSFISLINATGLPLSTGVTGVLAVANGGTGDSSYNDGELLIGNSSGNTLTTSTLTAGSNISITNGNGSITIAATGTLTSSLTNSHIFVGNVSNSATDVAVSGDLTLANTGAFTIANAAVTNAKIADATINLTTKVTGVLPLANGGTGANLSATGGASQVLRQSSIGAVVTVSQLANTDITGLGTMSTQNANNVNITGATQITGLPSPTGGSDAATKSYVDSATSGLTGKAPVRLVSTSNQTGVYLNGTAGVGATFTYTSTGADTIDGKTLVLNDRVLLTAQTSAFQNGAYTVTTAGALGIAGILTRATDYDQSAEIIDGTYFVATDGTTYTGTLWIMTTASTVTVGTTAINFTELNVGNQSLTFTGGVTGSGTGTIALTVQTNANLTGPITSVGNATSVTSQTGAGSTFVMDTSPTLITPIIGAATGTSLSVSGQLTSTVATGTSPLVVASTTNVANLNASSLSGATFAAPGPIGSGTASTGAFTTLSATGAVTITSASANALAVGLAGATNPALNIDASTASSVTGFNIKSAASGGGVTMSVISSATNENGNITVAKGTGQGVVSTPGNGTLILQSTGGQVRLSISGASNMVISGSSATFSSGATASASTVRFSVVGNTDTALSAGTEAPSAFFNFGQIRQHATGAITTQRDFRITGSTHSFVGASTITTLATVTIAGHAQAGTNATVTTGIGLYIPTQAVAGTVTNAYGASITSPTGAGTINAAQFVADATNSMRLCDGTNAINVLVGPTILQTATISSLTLGTALTVANGGTGQTSYTDGQLLIGNTSGNTLTKATLTAGANITITNGNGSITIASTGGGGSGTVTSVAVSGGTTGLTTSGGPITTSGTITLAGTLAVANGGTGQTSYTNGQILIGNTTGNTLSKATLTQGAGMTITNGTGTIIIANALNFVQVAASRNVTIGNTSLPSLSTGTDNTGMGFASLVAISSGSKNTAVGRKALTANTQGNQNVAVGEEALAQNTTVSDNTAVGYSALTQNVTGANNTGVGSSALLTSTGDLNTAVGSQAGATVATGVQNTLIGASADVIGDPSNATAIGYGAGVSTDNTMQFGNASVVSVLIGDNATTALSTGALVVNADTTMKQTATPANPASGFNKIYPKSDDNFYILNSAGVETQLAAGGGGGSGLVTPGYAANLYYTGIAYSIAGADFNINHDVLYYMPLMLGAAGTFTKIGIKVATGGSAGNVRLGIYNMANGVPTTLIVDAGTVSTATNGEKEITISETLAAGCYALVAVLDTDHNLVYATSSGSSFTTGSIAAGFWGNPNTSGSNENLFTTQAFPYAALPGTFSGSLTYADATNGIAPAIWLRL